MSYDCSDFKVLSKRQDIINTPYFSTFHQSISLSSHLWGGYLSGSWLYGNLNDLNVKLFYKILEIAKNYEDYEKEMFLLVEESAQKIQGGNHAEEITHLAECNYHDSHILEVIYEKGMFTIAFDDYACDRVSKYSFKTEKIRCDISLSELLTYQVLYEEVFFQPSDNLFEYNILIIKCGYGKEANQIEELRIIFSEIVSLTHEERHRGDRFYTIS